MNANQLINMIIRIVSRRLLRGGINAGIDYAARGGQPAAEMSPEQRQQARQGKQAARRARQAAKLSRRVTRL